MTVLLRCPSCGHDSFDEIRDATLIVSCTDRGTKLFRGMADWGSSIYMMSCRGCGRAVEWRDLVPPAPSRTALEYRPAHGGYSP